MCHDDRDFEFYSFERGRSYIIQITSNIDGISLLEKKEAPDGGVAKSLQGGEATECFDATYNNGTKSLNRFVRVIDCCRDDRSIRWYV